MTMKRWDGAALVDLATAKRWDGSAMVDLTVAKRWTGSAFVDIPLPGGGGGGLSVTISQNFIEDSVFVTTGPSVLAMAAGPVTVTATGGTGAGPTYSWAKLSGDSGITATNPTNAATNFKTTLTKNSERLATFRCTVTRGAETGHVDVDVYFSYYAGIIP